MKKLLILLFLITISCNQENGEVLPETMTGVWGTSWHQNTGEYFIDLTISDDELFECTQCQYTVIGIDSDHFYQADWPVLESEKNNNQIRFIFQRPNNRWKFEGTYFGDEMTLNAYSEKDSIFVLWKEEMVFERQ